MLLDIGKGMFDEKSLEILNKNNFLVYRLDVTPALNTLIEETNTIKNFSKKKFLIKKKGKFIFTSSGLLGSKNSILVDSPINPKVIFGICDGQGDFKRISRIEKKIYTKEISSLFKRRVSFL